MGILQIIQLVFQLGPEALQLIEAIIAAINATPGTPQHAAALETIKNTKLEVPTPAA